MPDILHKKIKNIRKRDIIFHLTEGINIVLKETQVESCFQPFCINTQLYKNREDIKREEHKIVFIGSSYKKQYLLIEHPKRDIICQEIYQYVVRHGYFPISDRLKYIQKYKIDNYDFGWIINYIERDLLLKDILHLDIGYKFEVYGDGWDEQIFVEKFYKGRLQFGEEISKVYNSVKYGIVLGGYIFQNRTLEMAASGCIPLVFDVRLSKREQYDVKLEKHLKFFSTVAEIETLLKEKNDKINLDKVVVQYSYENFLAKCLKIVETT
jgi:hypothetical protein